MHRAASYTPALCGPEKAALGAAEHRPPSVRPSVPPGADLGGDPSVPGGDSGRRNRRCG